MMVGAKQTLQLTCHFLVTSVIGETLSGHSGLHRIYRICWFQLSDESCRLCNSESRFLCKPASDSLRKKTWQVSCRSSLTNSREKLLQSRRDGAAGCERCQLCCIGIILTPIWCIWFLKLAKRLHVLLRNVTVGTKIACTTVDGKNPAVTS